MSYHRKVNADVESMLSAVMQEHHKPLVEAGVTVSCLYHCGSQLKLHGYPAAAVVKINSQKDRVEGKADATITIDFEAWEHAGPLRQRAVLDHELQHLEVVTENGQVEKDDCGRPKLRMRKHDWELGGFWSCCERNGPDAAEAQNLGRVVKEFQNRQLTFPWG